MSGGGVSSFMRLASVGMWFSCSIEVGSSGSGGGSGGDRLVLTCVELQAVISSATLRAMGSRRAGPTLPRDGFVRRLNDPPPPAQWVSGGVRLIQAVGSRLLCEGSRWRSRLLHRGSWRRSVAGLALGDGLNIWRCILAFGLSARGGMRAFDIGLGHGLSVM
jgi:hypothetical protein